MEHQIDVIPGITSPSDVEQAMEFGLSVCKFFPAAAYGGTETLKALIRSLCGNFFPADQEV